MLTERVVRDARPEAKPRIVWDKRVKGLGLKIQPGGTKSYILDYRARGRQRRVSLGRVTEISLKAARERAGRELGNIRDGGSDLLERRQEAATAPTVVDLVKHFLEIEAPARMERGRMSARTVGDYHQQCNRYILPALGKRKVADVRRQDVEAMVRPLKPVQHNRVLALASRLFTLAERLEWRPQHDNPARGIERHREQPRDRVLSTAELGALAKALADVESASPAAVAATRVAMVTGLRIGEVLSMRWEHVDMESGRVILPATKTGARVHDLPTPALEVLAALPRINGWCFTTGTDAPITYKTARKVFARAAAAAGLEDVKPHDMRRTVATAAAAAGMGAFVIRDLLGHAGVAMANRYVRRAGVRDAREQIGGAIAAAMKP